MSVLTWLKEKVFGKNGYDPVAQDRQIREIRDETLSSKKATQTHFALMKEAFEDLKDGCAPSE